MCTKVIASQTWDVFETQCSVAAQETAKHRAKFGWPPVSDVAAVPSQDAKPMETCWGAPNSRTDLSNLWAGVHHTLRTCRGDVAA